jgi:hypothetical protein
VRAIEAQHGVVRGVARLVGNEGRVVSGVTNLESSGVEAPRPSTTWGLLGSGPVRQESIWTTPRPDGSSFWEIDDKRPSEPRIIRAFPIAAQLSTPDLAILVCL